MAEFRDSIDIHASPETVFAYLTTDAGMTAWMGQYADLVPTPGGRFAVDIAGHAIRGEYLHVEFPSRVVVSWGMAGFDGLPPGASTVEFRLTRITGGTRVDLTHSGLPDTAVRGHEHGWRNFLPRLATAGTGADPGPDTWRPLEGNTPLDVVQSYHRAWTTGDITQAMTYVADDITCRAPGRDLNGKDAYRAFLAGFAPTLTGITDIASFTDGDQVALFYHPETAATSTAPAAEYFTVKDGKITESVLIFDRLSYTP